MASTSPPIISSTLQATLLSATSNVLAQVTVALRNGAPISLDYTPILHFAIFTVINVPPNILWQDFLESSFPSRTRQPVVRHVSHAARAADRAADVKATRDEWVETVRVEERLDVRNTACKFVLDQTLGAFVNTVFFLAGMAALEGKDSAGIMLAVREQMWPLMLAGFKLWPAVSLLQFTVVPPHMRVIVGCIVGVGWSIFLSIFVSTPTA